MLNLFKNLKKKEILFITISILCIIFQVYLELKIPEYMSTITGLLQIEGTKIDTILRNGLLMLLCSFGSLIFSGVVCYLASYVGTSFEKNLRKKLFDKVESFGMEEIKNFSTSSLITRATNDIRGVKMFLIMGLQVIAKTPIMAFMAIMKIVGKEWTFSLITIVGVLVILILNLILIFIAIPRFKKIQSLTDNINKITRENLTGIRVVRAYNAESYQVNKFEKVNKDLTNTQMFVERLMSLINPVMTSVMSGLSLAIYWAGAYILNNSLISNRIGIFSDMVVFSSYAVQIIISFMLLGIIFVIYPRASVSANRINEVLKTESKIKDGNIDKDSTGLKGVIEFNNVGFKYPGAEEYVLKNVNFKINNGETIGIIGSTGSGKSTLINLIPRFYDVTDGEVLVDGINVKDYRLELLYNIVGYVPQKAVMFDGTVNYNISYGEAKKKISKEKIREAIKVAQAKDFVEKMDKDYNSHIASGGTNVSGGQKQRLSMARAIARDPEIYIFDDSFSALDYSTDYNLRKELKKYTKDATNIIVAQRIGTVLQADKIIVLDEGKCVGIGTHKELLKSCEVYKQIALSQLSKEELENA